MIDPNSRLGRWFPTQRGRQRLVMLYYALLGAFTAVALWRPEIVLGSIMVQTATFGGMLGGIRPGGLVKPYDQRPYGLAGQGEVQTLDLDGEQERRNGDPRLDERETHERDHAHFIAYRLLRWSLLGFGAAVGLIALLAPMWLERRGLPLLWTVAVYTLSLPQSVLLWNDPTEPEEPARTGIHRVMAS